MHKQSCDIFMRPFLSPLEVSEFYSFGHGKKMGLGGGSTNFHLKIAKNMA